MVVYATEYNPVFVIFSDSVPDLFRNRLLFQVSGDRYPGSGQFEMPKKCFGFVFADLILRKELTIQVFFFQYVTVDEDTGCVKTANECREQVAGNTACADNDYVDFRFQK